ncbi:MAG: hypothetical protein JNL58_00145 [Planctomyces sp.]|nr:hypothetical protein [Planctomyces sp.]
MARQWINRVLIAVPLLVIAMLFAAVAASGSSAGGTLRSGRSVIANSDSIYCWCTFASDTATIKTGRKEIVVQPTALLVDGVAVAEIENDVAQIQVQVERGEVTFLADGKPVNTSIR